MTSKTSSTSSTKIGAATCFNKKIGCNFDEEITADDQLIIDKLDLSEEQLRLKKENLTEFWKSVAETVRSNLSDSLEDNQELHRLKDLIQEENDELVKTRDKLLKLANDAREIIEEYNKE